MKDERIRYRPAERAALVDHRVRVFCLTSGNLRAAEMTQLYIAVLDKLTAGGGAESPCHPGARTPSETGSDDTVQPSRVP